MRSDRRIAWLAVAWGLTIGCGGADPVQVVAEPAKSMFALASAGPGPAVAQLPTPETPDAPSTTQALAEIQLAAGPPSPAYQPPFPDRVELFVPPKRQGGLQPTATADAEVTLLGFVSVDRPRAILSIHGEVNPLGEGDRHSGIEVISVRPPHVVLQRGRQRWQATLQ
ncbi:MAG TPA: hypothetical protein PKC18_02995 [Lacipirellulaceae bacterium]|nr:hypothetical protein [Lacipirellulaceae bacterium]